MNPVLQGIENAAKALANERKRLNDTFEQLRRTARTFDPSAILLDDGIIITSDPPIVEAVPEEEAASAAPDVPQPAPAATQAEPEAEPQPAKRASDQDAAQTVLDYLNRMSIAVSKGSIEQALPLTKNQVHGALERLRDDHYVARTPLGLFRVCSDKERAALTEGGADEPEAKPETNGKAKRNVTVPHWTQKTSFVEAERRKKRVLDHLNANVDKDFVPQEIAKALGIERHTQVSEDLRDMITRGIKIGVNTNHRRPEGITRGRPSNSYYVSKTAEWIDPEGKNVDPFSLGAVPV